MPMTMGSMTLTTTIKTITALAVQDVDLLGRSSMSAADFGWQDYVGGKRRRFGIADLYDTVRGQRHNPARYTGNIIVAIGVSAT